jgi:hypothetical protein
MCYSAHIWALDPVGDSATLNVAVGLSREKRSRIGDSGRTEGAVQASGGAQEWRSDRPLVGVPGIDRHP